MDAQEIETKVAAMIAYAVEAWEHFELEAMSAYFDCIDMFIGYDARVARWEAAIAGKTRP